MRLFFVQKAKESDKKHYIVPYAPECGYVLDGPRLLANLELWGIVNTKNRPTLTEDEMYNSFTFFYLIMISFNFFTQAMYGLSAKVS